MIPLSHIRARAGVGNLGDLLSPLIVAAFTGRAVRFVPSTWPGARLAAIGTIGQKQRLGTVDLWGTGFAGRGDAFRVAHDWRRPRVTRLVPHALRGPFSAAMLRAAGLDAQGPFGDPAVLLPRLWPGEGVAKRHELGVFLHITETGAAAPDAGPRPEFRRYAVPEPWQRAVLVRPMHVTASLEGLRARVEDILACRRVLSTSLHALVLAEAYGIPCAVFDFHPGAEARVAPDDDTLPLDHRMRDFYAGAGAPAVPVFRTERHLETRWEEAIRFIDTHWAPLRLDGDALLGRWPARHGAVREAPLREGLEALLPF
ncbi:MAG: polysaccharide pyruvyl transferase family protein [Rubritepida sp.]|nr:polysaccharide pyruvyl transferase family protein [Rubritepida sp.]